MPIQTARHISDMAEAHIRHPWNPNSDVYLKRLSPDAGAYVTPELLSPTVRGATVALSPRNTATTGTLRERVDQVERVIVLEVLKEHDNNKTSAARALGITREGLHKKMKLLGIG
jgi:DNA-binding NtrC family response regulator